MHAATTEHLEPVLHNKKSHHSEKPPFTTTRKPVHGKDPAQPMIIINLKNQLTLIKHIPEILRQLSTKE